MTSSPGGKLTHGQRELQRGIECIQLRGRLEHALSHFDSAMTWALEVGDSRLWDRAFCNRCAAELSLAEQANESAMAELRQIVLRSNDGETSVLAAYNVARAYEHQKDYERALFYARIAHDRCANLSRRDWLPSIKNQIGNALVARSLFEEACAEYQQALRMLPDTDSVQRSSILDNLGYSRIVQGRTSEGLTLLFQGLRGCLHLRADFGREAQRVETRLRLSLCYGYLEVGRLRRALMHGLRSLEIADATGDVESIKNAHYLLGEAYNELGHHDTARDYFTRLQQRFYPDAKHVPEFLMAVDVRRLINLKA